MIHLMLALAPVSQQEPVSYHRDVQPLLTAHCAGCHSAAEPKGGLDLSSHASLMAGGDTGLAIITGKPDESLLVDVASPFDGLPAEMPPKDKGEPLSGAQLELLRRWIEAGAIDDTPAAVSHAPELYERLPVVTDMCWSPAGDLLAVTGRGEVLLHSADGERIVARLAGASPRIQTVAFSPDGKYLAVAGGTPGLRGELQVWDVAARVQLHAIPVAGDTLYGVSWSGDGTRVAFGGPDRALRAVDAATGEKVLFQMSHEDFVLDTAWSTDDSHLVSVSRDRSMKLVQVSTQQFIDNITSITPGALKGGLMAVARRPEADELLVGGADGVPKLYRMYREKKRVIGDDYNLIRAFGALEGRVYDVAWMPDGKQVAGVSSHATGGQVGLSAAEDGADVWKVDLSTGQYALAIHPGGKTLAVAGYDGLVRLLDATDGKLQRAFASAPLAPDADPLPSERSE